MRLFLRIFQESIRQALQQLWSNKLRSTLSLLGITIGIWCVIMVFSAVDSLEANIRKSFQKLGDDVVYISTMPWGEDPRENFWKYLQRPEPSYRDFEALQTRLNTASLISMSVFIGNSSAENGRYSASNLFVIGATEDYKAMFNLQFARGRYFTPYEFHQGGGQVILGYEAANSLFPGNPYAALGQTIQIRGLASQVVGILQKEGKTLINPVNFDNAALIPYRSANRFINLSNSEFNRGRTSITVKAKTGIGLVQLKDEVTGVLRQSRRLKPIEESNFELNTLSILSNLLGNLFAVIRVAGFMIGIFSIVVGVFSVANIMFVSVKERTAIIGVKKALGAKRYMILLEFLVESVTLCLIGGAIGLVFVYLAAQAITHLAEFEIFLSQYNIILGLGIAILSGIVAGILPANQAAKMDPVEAMRA